MGRGMLRNFSRAKAVCPSSAFRMEHLPKQVSKSKLGHSERSSVAGAGGDGTESKDPERRSGKGKRRIGAHPPAGEARRCNSDRRGDRERRGGCGGGKGIGRRERIGGGLEREDRHRARASVQRPGAATDIVKDRALALPGPDARKVHPRGQRERGDRTVELHVGC